MFLQSVWGANLVYFDVEAHYVLVERAELTSLTYIRMLCILEWGTRNNWATEWTFQNVLGTVVLDWFECVHAQVAVYFLQFDIQVLVKVKLMRIRALLLESCVVLFVLRDHVRFVGKETCWLQVQDQPSKMSCSNEVLDFVVVLQCVLVDQELVRFVHATNCHVAAQLGHSDRVLRPWRQKSFSLDFHSHRSDVLHEHCH